MVHSPVPCRGWDDYVLVLLAGMTAFSVYSLNRLGEGQRKRTDGLDPLLVSSLTVMPSLNPYSSLARDASLPPSLSLKPVSLESVQQEDTLK